MSEFSDQPLTKEALLLILDQIRGTGLTPADIEDMPRRLRKMWLEPWQIVRPDTPAQARSAADRALMRAWWKTGSPTSGGLHP